MAEVDVGEGIAERVAEAAMERGVVACPCGYGVVHGTMTVHWLPCLCVDPDCELVTGPLFGYPCFGDGGRDDREA
jgi:hypothetical protein